MHFDILKIILWIIFGVSTAVFLIMAYQYFIADSKTSKKIKKVKGKKE